MKYLSTFSGVGGFEIGIQRAMPEAECVGLCEIDKYASQVLNYHFPNIRNYGDITKINTEELPDFDLLVGGFPCQAFSIAGKRKGFEDTRGTLFFELARILRAKRPRLFIFENVKGLLSHDNGQTFRTIISTLDELRYDLQWQVLNSKNHGVPQNRERIFIVGHLRGTSRPEVFPFGGTDKETSSIVQLNTPTHSNDRVYGTDGLSPTLNTMQGGNRQPFVAAMRGRNPENPSDRTVGAPTEQRLEVNENGTSNTLTSVGKDNLVLEQMKIRRLTPLECERLMSFPDGWTKNGAMEETFNTDGYGNVWSEGSEVVEISDSQRYKMCGNGVVSNVVEAIVRNLI